MSLLHLLCRGINRQMKKSWSKEKGIILPLVLIFALLLMISGLAFMSLGIQEGSLVQREISKRQAFYLAEAGLERALYDLRQDFEEDSRNWADGEINEIKVDSQVDEDGFSSLLYDETSLGSGFYAVAVKNIRIELKVTDEEIDEFIKDEIWVKARGTFRDVSKTIQAYVTIENLSPWNNAIFCAETPQKKIDSANIHGSVHLLGKEGKKKAFSLVGSAHIQNAYYSIPEALKGKIPPPPKVVFNEEIVESLKAKLRVKQGGVFLDFDAGIGMSPDHPKSKLEAFKPTLDGVYTASGFMGEGEDNVYSDNGKETSYNLGKRVKFPSLYDSYIDPVTKKEYAYMYWHYLKENSLHIKENEISYQTPVFNYSYPNKGSISWDGKGELEIDGLIYINGDLILGKEGQPPGTQTIRYEGKGILISSGSIFIHSHLFPKRIFPADDAIGLIAAEDIYILPQEIYPLYFMGGALFAEETVYIAEKSHVAGSIVANSFEMGRMSMIAQVPDLATDLPPGMIAGWPDWYITLRQWKEL